MNNEQFCERLLVAGFERLPLPLGSMHNCFATESGQSFFVLQTHVICHVNCPTRPINGGLFLDDFLLRTLTPNLHLHYISLPSRRYCLFLPPRESDFVVIVLVEQADGRGMGKPVKDGERPRERLHDVGDSGLCYRTSNRSRILMCATDAVSILYILWYVTQTGTCLCDMFHVVGARRGG